MKKPAKTEEPEFDPKEAVKMWKRGAHGDAIRAVLAAKAGPTALSHAIPDDRELIHETYRQIRSA